MAEETTTVEVPAKFKDLVGSIETMTVLDLAELVKVLEEKFGVSAAAPVAAAPAAGGGDEDVVEEKSAFDVEVTSSGPNKIAVIKVIRELTQVGLKDAKDLVDAAPKVVGEQIGKEEAETWKKKLEEAGAGVNLK